MKVLIIEDETELAKEITNFLEKQQYECSIVNCISDATKMLSERHFDSVVLDLGLPDGDGMQLIKILKQDHPQTFIIIASARGELEDRIKGLQDGADDYLSKPFSLTELFVRLQAIKRRVYGSKDLILTVGEFQVDIQGRRIQYQDQEIVLYKKEFDILSYLLLNKNRPLSRSQLYEHVWGDLSFPSSDSNYIDVHIKNIRKKLAVFASVDWLQSVRGIGYKACLP